MKVLYKVLFAIVVFQFVSCNKTKTEAEIKQSKKAILSEKPIEDTEIEVDQFSYPADSTLKVSILQTETFHNDEVDQNLQNKTWFGIFKDKEVYALKETKIAIKNEYDPVVDEDESEKTGWNVSASIKDTCVILIEKLPDFANRNIQIVKIPESVYPQESFQFQFSGTDYKLFAIGEKKKESPDSDGFTVANYKLYLTANVNGNEVTELLVAKKSFDDQMIKIIFAGDIDGDSKLDLIIDTASHYNVSSPTLYLSKAAEKEKKIIKPIGVFTYVGC